MHNLIHTAKTEPDTCLTQLNATLKVIVALSGGVDSSVAAWLLKQQGYQVEGLFMKNWEEDDNEHYCAAAADLADASAVCDRLEIPLHCINFAAEYWDQVFAVFLSQYQAGYTPNPDILCNKEIKFKAFITFATQHLKADFIATGHYVRNNKLTKKQQLTGSRHEHYQLLRGLDPNKDQSYFLYTLNQQQLARSLFPLGGWEKKAVRHTAQKLGLITADKKESMGICFIGQRPFQHFLARYLPAQPGLIESTEGELLGHHQGVFYYTLGQRQGLGIGGTTPEHQQPWYVVDKDLTRNVLIVAQGQQHPLLQSTGLIAEQLHWITPPAPNDPLHCSVKIRYRQQDIPCQLIPLGGDKVEVHFQQPQIAVTPGQAAVFYQGEICLGGALITQRLQS